MSKMNIIQILVSLIILFANGIVIPNAVWFYLIIAWVVIILIDKML